MRKLKAFLLAAAVTAGLPAIAAAQRPGDDQQQDDRHRPNDKGDRQQRASDAPHGDPGNAQRAQADQQRAQANPQRAPAEQARPAQAQPAQPPAQPPQQPVQSHRGDFRPGDVRPGDDRRSNGAPTPGDRRPDARPDDRRFNGTQNPGTPNPGDRRPDFQQGQARPDQGRPDFRGAPQGRPDVRGDYRADGRYNRDWRQDRRYDWRNYRDQNRQVFRVPRYIPPRNWGWGYRRFAIGVSIPYFFFDQQYWIADPSYYRLPPAYGPYRWVRYYNDALLIDLRSGMVVDEIPDFFW